MSELAAIITAVGGVLASVGTGCGFVYSVVNKRIKELGKELEECEKRHQKAEQSLFQQGVLTRLGFDEFARVAPENRVLNMVQLELNRLYPPAPMDMDVPDAVREFMRRLNQVPW